MFLDAARLLRLLIENWKILRAMRQRRASFVSELEAFMTLVDPQEFFGVEEGELVEVYPSDSGFDHRDPGVLVGLDVDEVVIFTKARGDKH